MKSKQQIESMIRTLRSVAIDPHRTLAERAVAHAQMYALSWASRDKNDHADHPVEMGEVCAKEAHRGYVPERKPLDELVRDEIAAGRM